MRFSIYQAPFEQTALGFQPGADYEVVWEGELVFTGWVHPPDGSADDLLGVIWVDFQRVDPETGPWPPEGYTGRSLSVGDVVVLDGWAAFAVEPLGFSAVDLSDRPLPFSRGFV